MARYIKEKIASLLESLKKPREIKEESARPVGLLKFSFRYNDQLYDVIVYCNEVTYSCHYLGVLRYVRKFPIYEVYSVVTGGRERHEIIHVFDMTIYFPAIGNWLCSPHQQAAVAIDAYISVITVRFKAYLASKRTNA